MSDRRVALVTGAAGGLGTAVLAALARDGYDVVGVDVVPVAAPCAEWHLVDVRDGTALRELAADVVARRGRLDAVVAAAAVVGGGSPLWATPDSVLDELWEVDAKGVWTTAAATVPHLLASPEPHLARFVGIASAAGEHGLFGLAAYTAVKHAVVGIVRGLAADLAGTGVVAVAVSPGATRTPMLEATAALYGLAGEDGIDELARHQGLRRALEPAEVADVVALCCSPAGAALHGSVVNADGGFGI
ncbi:SDR family mycofactocin-dependent oxidoreductase [Nocardioides zeae]|uniref:SDR family mycofactocin-dependent oxidoreductase n=1 Tax=Nocardioides zeae TaxID=1457234 RepID=A0ACC6ILH5_9ACTN|nr:mycofactocin-coupled SDR family oxidoreductase [Nocardioides zeae]MDR6173936.1 SDR family mycofactocin-dependent oxidoreductase [Nocardioides zeae]MDR6211508.1 SDR family mycofactocin-dependent oxidoreductase [Nocardioides zeae]